MADKNERRTDDTCKRYGFDEYQRYNIDKCQRYSSDKYQRYECYEAYLLYEEFLNIPDNKIEFRIPEGMIITCDMMRAFLKVAYAAKGIGSIFEM